jgi:hypothetical protein
MQNERKTAEDAAKLFSLAEKVVTDKINEHMKQEPQTQ